MGSGLLRALELGARLPELQIGQLRQGGDGRRHHLIEREVGGAVTVEGPAAQPIEHASDDCRIPIDLRLHVGRQPLLLGAEIACAISRPLLVDAGQTGFDASRGVTGIGDLLAHLPRGVDDPIVGLANGDELAERNDPILVGDPEIVVAARKGELADEDRGQQEGAEQCDQDDQSGP